MASSSAPLFMDMSDGATSQPNPFAMNTGSAIPMNARGIQHGSLEQNTGTDSRGTYQHLLTDPTPPPSRSHSARGQRRDERNRDRERSPEYDDRRSNRADVPIGVGFRVQAVETSLAQHHGELQAQRIEIDQLKQMVQTLMSYKEVSSKGLHDAGVKLENCFGHVDSKHTEALGKIEHFYESARSKFENLTAIP